MRYLTTTALAALMTVTLATDAEARRGGGTKEVLEFVAPTNLIDTGGAVLSLCHLVEKNTFVGISIFSTSQGYALATDKCEVDNFYPLETAEFQALQSEGRIAAELPAEPSIGLVRTLWKYTFLGFVWTAIAVAALMALRVKMRTRKRRKEIGKVSKVALNTLDAMCHVAKTDGHIDAEEIRAIAAASEKLTGTAFEHEKIEKMIELSEKKLPPKAFDRFTKGLRPSEYDTVMRGVLMVSAVDGNLAKEELDFIGNLAAVLKVSQGEILAMLDELTGKTARPSPDMGSAQPA
jgi:tellurite resistance protein